MKSGEKRVVVMGASGRFGQAAVQAFSQAGWTVLAQMRPSSKATPWREPTHPETPAGRIIPVRLAPEQLETLRDAAGHADWVVHAINPLYADWERLAQPLLSHSMALASSFGARLMLPGNVYNFGSDMPALLNESTPQHPDTRKGRVRQAMESSLQEAARQQGLRSVVVRAGDFFGTGTGSWFDLFVVRALRKGVLSYPDAWTVKTPWAYLPDLARATALLADKSLENSQALAPFEVLHFKGEELSGQDWADLLTPIAREQGWLAPGKPFKRRSIPWALLRLISPFASQPREMLEMRYLWNTPHALDNRRLLGLLGHEPHTDLGQAARKALQSLYADN